MHSLLVETLHVVSGEIEHRALSRYHNEEINDPEWQQNL